MPRPKYHTTRNKILGGILLIAFLSVLLFSLFHVSAAGMGADENSAGCPFMTQEGSLCSMEILDHFSAWKSSFMAVVPSLILILMGALALAVVLPSVWMRQRYSDSLFSKKPSECTHAYRPLQELFSNGILHPKLF